MHFKTKSALAALLLLAAAPAWAQATVKQLGAVIPQHLSMYAGNGLVMDAGGAAHPNLPPPNDFNPGTRPSGLAIVNSGLGLALYSGYANGDYNELLLGFTAAGDGLIKLDRAGAGGPLTLWCDINGVRAACFGAGGSVTRIDTGTGLTGGTITTAGTISLADTPVVPGPYTYVGLTVDAQGRITDIVSEPPPGDVVTPGEPNGSLQYNNAGTFAGAAVAAGLDMTDGLLSLAQILNDQSGGDYTILTDDGAKTVMVGAHSYALPQAGTAGFEAQWGTCVLNIGGGNATLSATTSVFKGAGGATSLTLRPGGWACPSSDGTDYPTLAGNSAAAPVGANPAATAGPAAVNGSASTFMRSDAAPAVQKASAAQFGIVEVDGSTITASGGVISATGAGLGTVTSVATGTGLSGGPITTTGTIVLDDTAVTPGLYTYASLTVDQQGRLTAASSGAAPPSAANPTATAGPAAVNGSASTYMRSDAAAAVQKASAAQFGIVEVDGSTITASGGVISSVATSAAGSNGAIQYASSGAFAGAVVTGLVLGNGSIAPSAYGGTSCTNQFPRSLSAAGAATCATVANADLANSTISGVALGGVLAALTATDATLTFSGSYTGATARTVGVAQGANFTWTGTHKFGAVFGRKGNGGSDISAATYTVTTDDCGTTLVTTRGSTVTVTVPAALVSGSDTCGFGVWQDGAGVADMTGSAVSAATRVSRPGWTKTAGQYALLGVSVAIAGGVTEANITGDGAP